MKKTFKFFAAALAIVAAASCAKEISNDNIQVPEQELVHKVFSASLNVDSGTKTTLHTDGVSVHWTENDAIRIAPENTASWGEDLHAIAIDETFAVFEGDVIDSDKYWAVYPAGAVNTTNSFGGVWGWKTDESTIILSNESGALATQYAVDNNFSIAGAFMASSNFAVSVSSDDNPTTLSFKNINAYLKVNLAMSNASKIELSSDAVSSVPSASGELTTTSDSELGGPIVLNFKSETAMAAGRNGIPHVGIYNSTEIITFAYENGENLKSGVNYYIAIPAVKIEGLKLVVKDANGKVLQTMTKKSTFTAEPNKIYNLGVIEEAKVEPAKVGDYFYSDGTYSTTLDNSKKVLGVVFFVGDPTESDPILARDYPNCSNGLVLGLYESQSAFGNYRIDGAYSNSLYDGDFGILNYGAVLSDTAPTGYGLTLAYGNYRENIKSSSGYENSCILFDVNFGFASTYNRSTQTSTSASRWYIPSRFEMNALYENKELINSKLDNVGGVLIGSTRYWSSYVYSKKLHGAGNYHDCYAYPIDMNTGDWITNASNTTSYNVRAILAF